MTLIIFIIVLSILIVVHEWGHYAAARRCGVRVEQFALGFGPKLFSWKHDGTDFMLCAIPLGGYVKMAGDERDKTTGKTDEFFAKSIGQRAFIVLAGPVVNFILAFVCFWAVFMIGFVDLETSSKMVKPVIGQILENSPAQKAGLQTGDQIISIDGKAVSHWPDIQDNIMASTGTSIVLTVDRQGQQLPLEILPEKKEQKDIFGRVHTVKRIGVGPVPLTKADDVVIKRYGPIEALVKAGQELVSISVKTYAALYEMIIGARSPKEAMGIVGMFFVIKFALSVGFAFLLHIVGVISASLAIFNLLPIIPLDGGHLLMLWLEKIRGKMLSLKTEAFIARLGFSFIIVLALFVFYVDFERIGLIDKIRQLF